MAQNLLLQITQMLDNLSVFLAKSCEQLEGESVLQTSLAPDMFNLTRQVQSACDTAKFAASRLSGREAPRYEDDEKTKAELQARIQKTIDYLKGFSEEDFVGIEDRKVVLPFAPDLFLTGPDYLHQFVVPNFYFHLTTAYSILRNQGAKIGKRDFLRGINMQPLKA